MSKGALAFLAGMGSGYLNESKRQEDKKRQDQFDQIALDKADYDKQERDRTTKIRTGVSAASQDVVPVEIQDHSVNAPLAAQGSTWQIGKKVFTSSDEANKAALEMNTPQGRNDRIAQEYRMNGDAEKAMDIESKAGSIKNNSLVTQGNELALNQAKEQEARLSFGRGMVDSFKTGGSGSLMQFLSDSHADGKDGGMKFEQQLSPDGKVATVFTTNDKGEKSKVADVPNNDEGWQMAMFKLQKGLDPNALMAHSAQAQKQALEERKVRATEMKAENDSRRADANDRKIDAYIMGGFGRGGSSGSSSDRNNVFGIPSADLEKASNTINSRITEIYQPKEGSTPEERAKLGVERNKASSEATGIWAINNRSGNYIDTNTSVYAQNLAKDDANVKMVEVSGTMYEGVFVNGKFVKTSEALKPMEAPPPQSPPPPSKTPPPLATTQGIAVPKASEYKGEGIGTKIIGGIQSGWKNVEKIQESVKKSKQEAREQSQAALVKSMIENKMEISEKQKALAVKYGFLGNG